jgi:large subunit ribosomal protein L23
MAIKKQKTQNPGSIITSPRITEKSAVLSEGRVYTFNVAPNATKIEIKKAIEDIYGVAPVKITTATLKYKPVQRRGVAGVKGGGKKAMVYLKKGDTIQIM